MCEPASFVIVRENGGLRVLWDACISESHEDIIDHFGLTETNVRGETTLVRVEITPPLKDFAKPLSEWRFRLDQDIAPPWYDPEEAERCARAELPKWLAAKVVLPGQLVDAITGCRYIVAVCDSATVENVCDNATVESVWDNATVESVWDNATVKNVFDNATVTYHTTPDLSILHSGGAVLIDRSQSDVKAYVGKQGDIDTEPPERRAQG